MTVSHVTYKSKFCGHERGFNILLPENYSVEKKYPVVYFLHGFFCNEFSIINDKDVNIKEVLAKNSKEMIVVFPNIFARKNLTTEPDFNAEAVRCYDDFIFDLTEDLMPFIKENYPVLEGKENTAICGFSMGGREALFIGLSRPDLFGYIGGFAPAPGLIPGKDNNMVHEGQLKAENMNFKEAEKPFYLQVSKGTEDDVVGDFPLLYHDIFSKNNVSHSWQVVENAGHNYRIINPAFEMFAENIFR